MRDGCKALTLQVSSYSMASSVTVVEVTLEQVLPCNEVNGNVIGPARYAYPSLNT